MPSRCSVLGGTDHVNSIPRGMAGQEESWRYCCVRRILPPSSHSTWQRKARPLLSSTIFTSTAAWLVSTLLRQPILPPYLTAPLTRSPGALLLLLRQPR